VVRDQELLGVVLDVRRNDVYLLDDAAMTVDFDLVADSIRLIQQ